MDFRIADTFTDSLARLTGDEQKAAKTTAFDLQVNPAQPGLQFHKLDRAKDRRFWSVRVSSDIRLIVHRSEGSLLLCYVDHHDRAYDWAERRKLETHPRTGAAQLVEIRETVKEIVIPVYVTAEEPAAKGAKPAPPLAAVADEDLLGHGVPAEWVADVKRADEATLLALAERLPAEAAEAVLELATGGRPRPPRPATPAESPFDHPDAQRRFRVVKDVEALRRALDFPWERWTIFLHPEQRHWVEKEFNGPARVAGSAGTGKTIVALHRAVHLARRHGEARVLLTTFTATLANALKTRLKRLIADEPALAERIDVRAIDDVALRLHRAHIGPVMAGAREVVRDLVLQAAAETPGHRFGRPFLVTEWEHVVDAWQLASWEAYREVARLGRKTRVPEAQRKVLWSIFERARGRLVERAITTLAGMYTSLAAAVAKVKAPIFDFVIVDEAQDLSIAQLRFLAALGARRPDALFFAGDLGQRIFQVPFSWKSLGVDIRGRSRTLRVNYRTSHQIRSQADRLLDPQMADADGNTEERAAISVFNGPAPRIESFASEGEEGAAAAGWLGARTRAGAHPHEIGVFVRSEAQLGRAKAAVAAAGLPHKMLDELADPTPGHVSIGTMHLAKGLEFRAVAVMACDDEVIPLQERIEAVGDEGDLQEAYDTERQLLYVACTRARDELWVSCVRPGSEFVGDMSHEARARR